MLNKTLCQGKYYYIQDKKLSLKINIKSQIPVREKIILKQQTLMTQTGGWKIRNCSLAERELT
jgi:hypothetical protein